MLPRESSALVAHAIAEALGPVPGADALAHLLRLERAESPLVRLAAQRGLCRRSEPAAQRACREASGQADLGLRLAGLGLLDDAELRALLDDPRAEVRAAVVGRLARGGGAEAIGLVSRSYAAAREGPGGLLILAAWLERAGEPTAAAR
jgi:hypothetical protein